MQFKDWLIQKRIKDPPSAIALRLDPSGTIKDILPVIKTELAKCYLNPGDYEDLLRAGGMHKVYDELKKHFFPKTDRVKRGVFGETIAMLWVRDVLGFEVPFVKRQWAMQREQPQLGEDVIGFVFSPKGKDRLMIVESKFYASTKGNLEKAIDQAHNTITKCMTATQCYSLYHISTLFDYTGKHELRNRVKSMFNYYKGRKFEKNSGIFITTKKSLWSDALFADRITKNNIANLNCWSVVYDDIDTLYEAAHR